MKTNKKLTTSIFCKNIVKYNTIQFFFFLFRSFIFSLLLQFWVYNIKVKVLCN